MIVDRIILTFKTLSPQPPNGTNPPSPSNRSYVNLLSASSYNPHSNKLNDTSFIPGIY